MEFFQDILRWMPPRHQRPTTASVGLQTYQESNQSYLNTPMYDQFYMCILKNRRKNGVEIIWLGYWI